MRYPERNRGDCAALPYLLASAVGHERSSPLGPPSTACPASAARWPHERGHGMTRRGSSARAAALRRAQEAEALRDAAPETGERPPALANGGTGSAS
jgi:hypothetical protein